MSKASSGALECYDHLYVTNNLARFLEESRIRDWKVIGTHMNPDSSRHLQPNEQLNSPTIIVMGSEGAGLSAKVSKKCHENVLIPGRSHYLDHKLLAHEDLVDSLNVSVATGILLHSFTNLSQYSAYGVCFDE